MGMMAFGARILQPNSYTVPYISGSIAHQYNQCVGANLDRLFKLYMNEFKLEECGLLLGIIRNFFSGREGSRQSHHGNNSGS